MKGRRKRPQQGTRRSCRLRNLRPRNVVGASVQQQPVEVISSDECSEYMPSYFSGEDETFDEVDLESIGNASDPNSERASATQHNIEDPNINATGSDDVLSDNDSYHSEELKTPISTDDEDDGGDKTVFPQFNANAKFGEVHLEVGMEFDSLATFKMAVKDYTIHHGRNIRWVKNDTVRCRAKCKEDGCLWEIYCAWAEEIKTFQIKTFKSEHNCCRGFTNSQADRSWVTNKLQEVIRLQPKITYIEAYDYMKKEFGVHINDTKLFRSLKAAKVVVEGNFREQYGMIWDYAHELLRSNNGSTVKVNCIPVPEGPPQFQRFYVCLEACKLGFKAGCRPFIGLDGCFLKGYYGGQLLAAVGQDANMQNFCIAYAIVDVENKDNWKWFLTLLHEDLGDYRQHGWNFMSDMQKGLIAAVQEVMPGVPHRFCAMHLWKNFIKHWKDKELRSVVWEAARSTTPAQFRTVMDRLKRKNANAWKYLDRLSKESWTKAYFSTEPKADNITNNTCEGFNSSILKYRGKPILTLAEGIRCYIMSTMSTNKLKMANRRGPLCPKQQSRLDKEKIISNAWKPIWAGEGRFQVQDNSRKQMDVDIHAHTCTCRFWQLTGIPCAHAVATIAAKRGMKPEEYCHAWLTIGAYNATYEHFVKPTTGQEFWEPTEYERPVPAPKNRAPGRPKKKRRKDESEAIIQGDKLKRSYPVITCSRCGLKGHNTNGCCNYGVPSRPPNWVEAMSCSRCGITGHSANGCCNYGCAIRPPIEEVRPEVDEPEVDENQSEIDLGQSQPQSQSASHPFGFGEGTFDPMPTGVRPPPVRGPAVAPFIVPYPTTPGTAPSREPSFMSFIPTPMFQPRGPHQA